MRQTAPIRVLVADDNALVREGLVGLLVRESAIDVVGEASDGLEVLEKAAILQPDVVVLDIGMPKMSGLEAARMLRISEPSTRVLVLTMYDDEEYVLDMVRTGAAGYLLKESAGAELAAAVRALGAGKPYFGQHALRVLVGGQVDG